MVHHQSWGLFAGSFFFKEICYLWKVSCLVPHVKQYYILGLHSRVHDSTSVQLFPGSVGIHLSSSNFIRLISLNILRKFPDKAYILYILLFRYCCICCCHWNVWGTGLERNPCLFVFLPYPLKLSNSSLYFIMILHVH